MKPAALLSLSSWAMCLWASAAAAHTIRGSEKFRRGAILRTAAENSTASLSYSVSNASASTALSTEVTGLMHLLAGVNEPCVRQEWYVPPPPGEMDMKKFAACYPTIDAFIPNCVKYVCGLTRGVDSSYTDIQLKTVLEHECQYNKEFPHVYSPSFEKTENCVKFAQHLTDARYENLKTGSTEGYYAFCRKYYGFERVRGGIDPPEKWNLTDPNKLNSGGHQNAATSRLLAVLLLIAAVLPYHAA